MQWIRYDDNDIETCTDKELSRMVRDSDDNRANDTSQPVGDFSRQTYAFQVLHPILQLRNK